MEHLPTLVGGGEWTGGCADCLQGGDGGDTAGKSGLSAGNGEYKTKIKKRGVVGNIGRCSVRDLGVFRFKIKLSEPALPMEGRIWTVV